MSVIFFFPLVVYIKVMGKCIWQNTSVRRCSRDFCSNKAFSLACRKLRADSSIKLLLLVLSVSSLYETTKVNVGRTGAVVSVADYGSKGAWFETWPRHSLFLWSSASHIYPLLSTG